MKSIKEQVRQMTQTGSIATALVLLGLATAHAQHEIDVSEEYKRLSDPSVREGHALSCGISALEGHRPQPLPLELRVMSLSQRDLTQGDKITFEVKIKNIGKETIAIPWSVIGSNQLELCSIERRLWITFNAVGAVSGTPPVLATRLFGFPFDQSLLPLQTGETATIRADWWIQMDGLSQEPREIELTPKVVLFQGGLATEEVVSENLKIRVRARPQSR